MSREYKVKRKLQEQGGSYLVTLPKIWVDSYELKEGALMSLVFNGIVKIKPPLKHQRARIDWRKQINKGTSLEKNLPLVKEGELQVIRQGNVLFAGWTVPITLGSKSNFVPPSCLFFEGYRELGTGIVETKPTLNRIQKTEFYGFEAFVSFFLSSSKYSGPGTDGVIFRDIIVTSFPKTLQKT